MRAVYKQWSDGRFELVAAFAAGAMPPLPSDWAQEIAEWLNNEGETARITECSLESLTTVKT